MAKQFDGFMETYPKAYKGTVKAFTKIKPITTNDHSGKLYVLPIALTQEEYEYIQNAINSLLYEEIPDYEG